jgi:hypothetical protein
MGYLGAVMMLTMTTLIAGNEEAPMLKRMWQTSPELIATAALMLVVLAGAIVGLLVDPTIITGMPAWLKPAKFAVSITIYTVTLAWMFTLLPEWPRTRKVIGWITAIVMVVEMAIIGSQAWRGTTSHFNRATTYDAVLFSIMGGAIVFQTFSTVAVAVALWRNRFADKSLGWALRFGMIITIFGAMTGGLMARPTAAQIEAKRAGVHLTVSGSHTVGGVDGGPGLPGTGWSTQHGDLRIPHFFGLHAQQALPLFALFLARRRVSQRLSESVRVRLVLIAAASYAALYVILLIQALRGVPLFTTDATTMTQLGMWAVATATAAALAWVGDGQAAARQTAAIRG